MIDSDDMEYKGCYWKVKSWSTVLPIVLGITFILYICVIFNQPDSNTSGINYLLLIGAIVIIFIIVVMIVAFCRMKKVSGESERIITYARTTLNDGITPHNEPANAVIPLM